MLPKRNDNEILDALRLNAEQGFRMLLKRFQEPIYWHIRRITVLHADAEDAMQETFIRVYKYIGKLKDDMSIEAWIYKIATNEALRQRERHKDLFISLDDGCVKDADRLLASPYTDFSNLEAVKLQNAILSLPPKQQVAFNLRYYDEFDYDMIARITGSTAANVKVNYHIAKEKIINYMKSHD